MFRNILVICTANICRSPMAEALLRAKVPKSNISSAGTHALSGREAATYTSQVMQLNGYDTSTHRARQATEAILKSADLILAIDASHVGWIVRNYPHLHGRVHKLGKWRSNVDVPDPYGGPMEGFVQAYGLIDACIGDWLPHLNQ